MSYPIQAEVILLLERQLGWRHSLCRDMFWKALIVPFLLLAQALNHLCRISTVFVGESVCIDAGC